MTFSLRLTSCSRREDARTIGALNRSVNPPINRCRAALVNVRKSTIACSLRRMSRRAKVIAASAVAVLSMTAIAAYLARSDRAPTPSPAPVASSSSPDRSAPLVSRLRAGIMLPVVETRRDFFGVLTPCEVRGWVRADEVEALSRANTADNLDNATVVIDAGHGGSLPGSVGPTGLREAEPNLAIARALAGHLGRARVFLTRDGDYTAGLAYRNAIANSLGAHALVSLHNNADPDGPFEKPGSETYYQYRSTASKRLSGLVYEELVRALARFPVAWVADRDAGAKYRLNSGGADYYALLRGSRVPAVIVESLFVSNRPEEDLLRRPDVVDAIAGAVASGLRRFFESEDPGSG